MFKPNVNLHKSMFLIVLLSFMSCQDNDALTKEDPMVTIEEQLGQFVQSLVNDPPDSTTISHRVKQYLAGQPQNFFGSTVALLDSGGRATYSPYWYRSSDSLAEIDLSDTSYHIDDQEWLRKPIDSRKAIWTDIYFDAGGGEIWMRTHSIPVIVNNEIIAVATTDLEVDKP